MSVGDAVEHHQQVAGCDVVEVRVLVILDRKNQTLMIAVMGEFIEITSGSFEYRDSRLLSEGDRLAPAVIGVSPHLQIKRCCRNTRTQCFEHRVTPDDDVARCRRTRALGFGRSLTLRFAGGRVMGPVLGLGCGALALEALLALTTRTGGRTLTRAFAGRALAL